MKSRKSIFLQVNSLIFTLIFTLCFNFDSNAESWHVDSYIAFEEPNNSVVFPEVIKHSEVSFEAWYSVNNVCNNSNNGVGLQRGLIHYPSGQLVLCGQNYPGWNSQEFSVPSVLYSPSPFFRNPDNGQYYKYLMSMAGQNLDGTLPWPGEYGLIGLYYSNDGINWLEYSQNPILYDNVISNLIGDGKYHSVIMFDLISDNGGIVAVVCAPEYPIPTSGPTTETFTWAFAVNLNGGTVSLTKLGKLSGNGIDVNVTRGYPGPWLMNVRIAKDDSYYYISRHDAHDFPTDPSDFPDEGQIYRILKGQEYTGTWEKLVEYGCGTSFPLVGDLSANEGTAFETDGFGQLWWYMGGTNFYAYTSGADCYLGGHLKAVGLSVTLVE